jgi:hypothetical protein
MTEDTSGISNNNKVIGGLYKGFNIGFTIVGSKPYVTTGLFKKLIISPETCESVVLQNESDETPAESKIDPKLAKGLEALMEAGAAALGGEISLHIVITYKDGQKSLAVVDPDMWDRIQGAMFKG